MAYNTPIKNKEGWELNIPYWVRDYIEKNSLDYSTKEELNAIGVKVIKELTKLAKTHGKETMGFSSWMGDVATIREWLKR